MADYAPGDQLVSFGGFVFDPLATTKITYPRQIREQVKVLPGADYAVDVYGSSRAPRKMTQLTASYFLQAADNPSLKNALIAMQASVLSAGVVNLVTRERSGFPTRRALARCVSCDGTIEADNLTYLDVTLVWNVLSNWS